MPFDTYENSIEDGMPLRLYRFSLNDKFWYYTNADANIQKMMPQNGEMVLVTFLAVPIEDDGISQTGEASSDALTVRSTTDIIPAQLYMRYPPARPVQVTIFDAHEGQDEIKARYVGEITQCDVPQPGAAVLTCETIAATLAREGLRLGWQRTCPYALYDPVTCKVPKETWGIPVTVTAVVDNLVTVATLGGAPDGRFAGGFVEWLDVLRGIERRGIEEQTGTVLMMFGTADGIAPGIQMVAYPGCARTTGACAAFNNLDNYGGAPALQGKSPFDGTPVFN